MSLTSRAQDRDMGNGPVIVLTYAHAGAGRLQRLLSSRDSIACTSGTGVLPLCDLAASTWREVENRGGPLSPLAQASVRALANSIITAIQAGLGGSRWCEAAFAPPSSAQAFLDLYPAARFLCLHRNCLDVIYSAIQASPWGLAGTALGPFAAAYPGNSAAVGAAYWVAATGPLLQFEEANPGACCRVRYEDLIGATGQVATEIFTFLGEEARPADSWLVDGVLPVPDGPDTPGCGSQVPAGQIPPPLRARVNELLARIGYQPVPGR
jgi:hypothetical protein